jgi:LacI family transcriptional regulator
MASRVLGGYGSFSAETARRVLDAARRLDYRPDLLARSLRLGRTRSIGLVVSYLLAPHSASFAREVDAAAARHSYQALVGTAAGDPFAEQSYLRTLVENRVAGIIAAPSPSSEPLVAEIVASGLPVVLLGSANGHLGAPRVNLADRDAARRATEHLLRLGHRRVAMIAGATELWHARERLEGYRDALRAAGIEPEAGLEAHGFHLFDAAYEAMGSLLAGPEPPTAVLAGNELIAGAVLQCLKDRDVSVPRDVSLVTFDDPPWAAFYRPALTAVRVPRAEVARVAVETLLAEVARREGEPAPVERVIELDLIVRESTAPPA